MIYGGTRLIPAILRRVAAWNARELFLISVMALGQAGTPLPEPPILSPAEASL
jgi:predicted Kef-type K+ transport protein